MSMSLSLSIVALIVGGASFKAPEVSHFPDSYFDAKAKAGLQRRAMETWPGPSQIVDLWQSGELTLKQKTAILLGASASHDPVLLPLYLEAVTAKNHRLRMAAAYGYRDLLGDALPDLARGVDLESARLLAAEMEAVKLTLRDRPLVEFWLQSVLMSEGKSMPGWRGVVIRRSPGIGLQAVEKVLNFEDFAFLATAYRRAEKTGTRVGLMKLLEAITLQRFFSKPTDTRAGWGSKDIDEAFQATDEFLDYWIDRRCTTDPGVILSSSMSTMGASGVRPLAPESYEVWLRVLKDGAPTWQMMAARQLYDLGGRWAQGSVFQVESQSERAARDQLLLWYRLLPAHILQRGDPNPGAQP
jgi:hypothetical protein